MTIIAAIAMDGAVAVDRAMAMGAAMSLGRAATISAAMATVWWSAGCLGPPFRELKDT